MASCPKCGKHIIRKSRDGLKKCRRHGPISDLRPDKANSDKFQVSNFVNTPQESEVW